MTDRGPGLRRTTLGDLAVPFVVIGVAVYILLRWSYDSIPQMQYVVVAPLAALAVIEFVVSRRVRAAVRHDPDARLMTAIAIARCVALGKATALVAAGVLGAALGIVARTAPDADTVTAAAHDTRVGVLLAVVAALLIGAGLLLERSGIDPGSDDDRNEGSRGRF